MKTNNKGIGLSLNSKHETKNQNNNINVKIENTKYVGPKYKQTFTTMK
jgi:hypothetical protein